MAQPVDDYDLFPSMGASPGVSETCKQLNENFASRVSFPAALDLNSTGAGYCKDVFNIMMPRGKLAASSFPCPPVRMAPFCSGIPQSACCVNIFEGRMNADLRKPLQVPLLSADKKFILFDRCGDCESMFVSPALEGPRNLHNVNVLCHPQGFQSIYKCQKEIGADYPGVVNKMPRNAVAQGTSTLKNMSSPACVCTCDSDNLLQLLSFDSLGDDRSSHNGCGGSDDGKGRGTSDSLHEDTEDLDALLSSDDDEKSTGRSPSELMLNDMLAIRPMDNFTGKFSGSCSNKPGEYLHEEESDGSCEEVESALNENQCQLLLDLSHDNEGKFLNTEALGAFEPSIGSMNRNDVISSHLFSALQHYSNTRLREEYTSFYEHSNPRKRGRNDNIKTNLRLLRSIMSGGSSMDTLDVLGEAIQCVRTLQQKFSQLETSKRARM